MISIASSGQRIANCEALVENVILSAISSCFLMSALAVAFLVPIMSCKSSKAFLKIEVLILLFRSFNAKGYFCRSVMTGFTFFSQ